TPALLTSTSSDPKAFFVSSNRRCTSFASATLPWDCDRLAALAGDLRDNALGSRLAGGVIHHDRRSGGCQALRDPRADSFRRPGHNRYLASQLTHLSSPITPSSI